MAGLGRIRRSTDAIVKAVAYTFIATTGIAATALISYPAYAAERTLLMGSFEDIIIIGDMQVNIITNKAPSAKATGDKRALDSLRLDRSGTVMTIRMQDIIYSDKAKPISQPLIINLTNRQVRNIAIRGNARLSVSELRQVADAKIGIDGGGDIRIGKAISDSLSASVSGNGSIHILGGSVRLTKVDMQGNGTFDAIAMPTQQLKLSQNGNATSSALIEERADITNIGAGNIDIVGKGLCFIRKAGSAIIKCAHTAKEAGK
jgi:Putative auto-transporter adhesin, head GIN domain